MIVLTHDRLKGMTKGELELRLRQERLQVTRRLAEKKRQRRQLNAEIEADELRLQQINESENYL